MVEIDAGNTFIKWRKALPGGKFLYGKVETLSLNHSADLFSGCFRCATPLDSVLISSVLSGGQTEKMLSLLRCYFVGKVYLAQVEDGVAGIRIAYAKPQALGVDRWLVMVGAYRTLPAARGICVIDAGSAITADFLAVDGRHVGGCIMPGWKLLNSALATNTQGVRVSGEKSEVLDFGVTTEECVSAGLQHMLWGAVSRVVGVAVRMQCSHVVITGGDGGNFLSLNTRKIKLSFAPDLVFVGLSEVYKLGGLFEV